MSSTDRAASSALARAEDGGRHSGARLVALFAVVLVVLTALALLRARGPSTGNAVVPPPVASATTDAVPADPAADLMAKPEPAPWIALTDQDGNPYTLASVPAGLAVVFFGFTHCQDICPDTVGRLETAMAAYGPGVHSIFVTVDPARDTVAALKDYTRYLAKGFTALTGTDREIRATADAWGVKYAKEESDADGGYEMSHTTDVYVIDQAGLLRARIPYGTTPETMASVFRLVASRAPTGAGTSIAPQPTDSALRSALELQPEIVSTSIWSGSDVPVILSLTGPAGRLDDQSASVSVQLEAADGAAIGQPVPAEPVLPPGLTDVSWIASVDIPAPGAYRFGVAAQTGAAPLNGSTALVTALDQGATPLLGSAVPSAATQTLADAHGDLLQLSTDPTADRRLYQTSTADALAQHRPFVLVLDSTRFRTTSACGKALVMIKYLLDRWRDTTFIHAEPFQYDVELDTPVLQGTLDDPALTPFSTAWGLGSGPWSATSMPWIFVVDGNGTLRAKYQGVVGTDDVDVILTMLAAE
jgi:protein SCO1/2